MVSGCAQGPATLLRNRRENSSLRTAHRTICYFPECRFTQIIVETKETSSRPVTSSSLTFPNMLPKLPARALPIKALFSALKSCKYYPIISLLIGQLLAGNKLGNAVLAF